MFLLGLASTFLIIGTIIFLSSELRAHKNRKRTRKAIELGERTNVNQAWRNWYKELSDTSNTRNTHTKKAFEESREDREPIKSRPVSNAFEELEV